MNIPIWWQTPSARQLNPGIVSVSFAGVDRFIEEILVRGNG